MSRWSKQILGITVGVAALAILFLTAWPRPSQQTVPHRTAWRDFLVDTRPLDWKYIQGDTRFARDVIALYDAFLDTNKIDQTLLSRLDQSFRQRFTIADADRNGVLSENEVVRIELWSGLLWPSLDHPAVVARFDSDGDGWLSFEETIARRFSVDAFCEAVEERSRFPMRAVLGTQSHELDRDHDKLLDSKGFAAERVRSLLFPLLQGDLEPDGVEDGGVTPSRPVSGAPGTQQQVEDDGP